MKGRPRSFDTDTVLEKVMVTFWERGYAGTSLSDLTEATGLTKPSLYAAYGNKSDMYRASIQRYLDQQSEAIYVHLHRDDLSTTEALRLFLIESSNAACKPDGPKGCLVLSSSAEACGGTVPPEIKSVVEAVNISAREMLVAFFERALGNAGTAEDVAILADFTLTMHTGLVQMATRGITLAEAQRTIDFTISCIEARLPAD